MFSDGVIGVREGMVRVALAVAAGALVLVASARASAPEVDAFPSPGSRLATRHTQISFRGVARPALGAIHVSGSRSGAHTGRIVADSDGRGASFYPTTPFVAGERVTIATSLNVAGGQGGTFHFTVERADGRILPPGGRDPSPRVRGDVDSFRSRRDLMPASVHVDRYYTGTKDIFLAPMRGPRQWGPMIVDRWGKLVWFDPLPARTWAASFEVQRYRGRPVLTWWQGFLNAGFGQGHDVIFNNRYHQIATVRAGNGLGADLHEFSLTPQGTPLITAYSLVDWDGSSVGSLKDLSVMDCTIQEIDIRNGNVLFQWDSLDHVPLTDSYTKPPQKPGHPYDYFHINSVQQDGDGNLIVSARNTWTVYKINHRTGAVMWRLGGKHSTFRMGPGTSTAYQHHATIHPGDLLTVFDDGGSPQVHSQSRATVERINTRARTATLLRELDHSPKLLSSVEGSAQLLAGGHVFVGWGEQPYFSEFDQRGHQLFDARFVGQISEYRAYEFPWHAAPDTKPAVALSRSADGISTIAASWNGATEVPAWRVLAGSSPSTLAPAALARRHGFETRIEVHGEQPYFAVQALDSSGRVLGRSKTVGSSRSRISMFSRAAFISGGGVGGLEVACFAARPCRLTGSISSGRTKIAHVTTQTIRANSGGVAFFTLSSRGRNLLSHARGRRLAVNATLRNTDGAVAFNHLDLVPYRTSGKAPAHSVRQTRSLRTLVHTAFISGGGIGGVFAQCSATTPCHVRVTVRAGGRVVATTPSQFIAAQDCGTLFFRLTRAGSEMLYRSRGNDLAAQLSASNAGQTAVAQISLVRYR